VQTDSRYPEKWPESLKQLENSGQKVLIPFPKPWRDLAKCKRWIVACSREFFTEKNVNKNTYICALHWPGGKGPTVEFPDPLKANLTPTQTGRASAPKRKAPKSREEPVTKQKKVINENYGVQSDGFLEFIPTDDQELLESSTTDAINESTTFDEDQVMCDVTRKHMYENLSGKLVSDQETQTVYSKYELSAKVETMILKNEVSTSKLLPPKIVVVRKHCAGCSCAQFCQHWSVFFNVVKDRKQNSYNMTTAT